MRTIRTVAILASIATLTLSACDDKGSEDIKSVKMPDGKIWMAKNLDIATGNSECYDKDPANCQKCGRLYDWETAIKACPNGWHLPTDVDFNLLAEKIGGDAAGKALKSKGGWDGNNGDDAYGFSMLPCGRGLEDGKFDRIGNMGAIWSKAEFNANKAYVFGLISADGKPYADSASKARLYSIRCIKNDALPAEQAKATEQQKEPEKPKTRSVYLFDEALILKNLRTRFFNWALGKDPCEGFSNPIKEQDCKNNLKVSDVLDKIEKEEIGKTGTLIIGENTNSYSELLPKPASKQLCNITVNFQNAIEVFDKERIDNLRREINETNAARKKNGMGELIGSEISNCLTLFENKYVYQFYGNYGNENYDVFASYALFPNKETAMNFEPKDGSKLKLKLQNIVLFYYLKGVGTPEEGLRKIKIYDYISLDPPTGGD